jgi:hypothetical protein
VILESHFSLPAAADMVDAALEVLQADIDINGGANGNAIRHAFCTRGMFTGAQCTPVTADWTLTGAPRTEKICAGDSGEFWLNVGRLGNFSGAATLSASGNPAGTTVAFNPNPVTLDTTSAMTVNNTGAVAAGVYTMTVSGVAAAVTHSDTLRLHVQSAPGAAALTAPAHGAANVSTTPTFTWNGGAQSDVYVIEVATDIGFSNVVLSATTTLPTYTAGTSLSADTNYYWRVTAHNSCDSATTSSVFVFSTGSTAPTAVTLGGLDAAAGEPVWLFGAAGVVVSAAILSRYRRRR